MLGGRIDERLRGSLKGSVRPAPRTPGNWNRRRTWVIGGVAAVLVIAGVLAWALWPSAAVEPRARQYRDVSACLLTDRSGVTGASAAPIWAAMQDASGRTHGQVRYLAVTGEQTAANAQTFAGTLIAGRCAVILAEPGIADAAVRAVAPKYPQQRFLVVGGDEPGPANVERVAGSQISTAVADRLTA